jgi:hypothetical protein
MKGSNTARDLPKNVVGTTTPVTYRSTAAVYRSLAAVPVQLDVEKHQARAEKQFASLIGPQTKNHGEVVWSETKDARPLNAREVEPVPIPLIVANAPHNTVYLESNPVSKVVAAVHELFEQQHVDFEYNGAKYKWKCACYDSQTETRFVSKLFSIPDKANFFVLDFQRRSGDPFHFQSIYKAINFKLLKSGFVVLCGDSKANQREPEIRTFKPMALPDNFFAEDEVQEEKGSKEYEPLCNMCLSPYIDVQREGLAALANHVETSHFARKALAPFAEKLMEAVTLSRDPQVRRLAISTVAGMSMEASVHSFVKAKGGLRVLVNVLLDPSELLETRRQAGRALYNIAEWDSDTRSILKRAQSPNDMRLIQLMKDLQSRLI